MRFHLLGLILMASVAAPAVAQRSETVEQRVNRLESQLRAVQRRVFPNGNVEPEIGEQPAAGPGGNLSGDAIASLAARVDALEGQLRSLTGQVEENGFRSRQLEQQIGRSATTSRPARSAGAPAAPPETRPEPARPSPSPRRRWTRTASGAPPAGSNDGAEEAYNAGFRLWDARRYEEAQNTLEAAAVRYPNSRWTSWMRNLQGRAYLDDNKPATAARILLANYQDNPEGERAADSLLYLGQALTRLNRRPEACRVLDELARVYPNMRSAILSEAPRRPPRRPAALISAGASLARARRSPVRRGRGRCIALPRRAPPDRRQPRVAVADSVRGRPRPAGSVAIAVAFRRWDSGRARRGSPLPPLSPSLCSRCFGAVASGSLGSNPRSLRYARARVRRDRLGAAVGVGGLHRAAAFAADRAASARAAPRPRRPAPGTSGGLTGAAPASSVSGCEQRRPRPPGSP